MLWGTFLRVAELGGGGADRGRRRRVRREADTIRQVRIAAEAVARGSSGTPPSCPTLISPFL